jgi:RNA polymerase sigma factor for flagellar operon FliA
MPATFIRRREASCAGRQLEYSDEVASAGDFQKRPLLARLADAVRELPEHELLIVSLYYQDGMNLQEIAQILEIPESRVCRLHRQALTRLHIRMGRRRAA